MGAYISSYFEKDYDVTSEKFKEREVLFMKLLELEKQKQMGIFKVNDSGGYVATTRDYMSGDMSEIKETLVISYTITAPSTKVLSLKKASRKYGIPFPDVKYTVIYSGFKVTIFYELDGYGIKASPLIMPGQIGGYPNITDKDEVTHYVLTLLICNQCDMEWENSIQNYLKIMGISYENNH